MSGTFTGKLAHQTRQSTGRAWVRIALSDGYLFRAKVIRLRSATMFQCFPRSSVAAALGRCFTANIERDPAPGMAGRPAGVAGQGP
jgi:hypothetical protein